MAESGEQNIGPEANNVGMHAGNLIERLLELETTHITNKLMLEMYAYLVKKKNQSVAVNFKTFHAAMCTKFEDGNLLEATLRGSIQALSDCVQKLKKNTKTEEQKRKPEILLSTPYKMPKSGTKRKHESFIDAHGIKLRKVVPGSPTKEQVKEENDLLHKENARLKKQNKNLKIKLQNSNKKLRILYGSIRRGQRPKRFFQAYKRRITSAERWKKKCVTEHTQRKKLEKRKMKQPIIVQKVGVSKSVHKITSEALKNTIAALKEKDEENKRLENKVEELKDSIAEQPQINTKMDGKRCNPKIIQASMLLQNAGLAEHMVSEAIKVSVEAVTGKSFKGHLPSKSTQARLPSAMKALSLRKVVEATTDTPDLTLKYDGTTDKDGRHVTEIEIATPDQTYLVGLRHQVGSTADSYVKTIKDTLNEIDTAAGKEEGNLLTNVTNTMTDRHVVNTSVDNQLETAKGGEINKFRCFMHPLDSFQKECDKAIKKLEHPNLQKKYVNAPFPHRGESMTQALIRCIDKLFHDQSIAIGEDLRNFLRSCGHDGKFLRWVGNKFNILFNNAYSAFLYKDYILTFLTKVKESQNRASLAVANMLKGQDCDVQLRCLGIISIFITGPWEREAMKDNNILDTNNLVRQADIRLKEWIEDPTPLLIGHTSNCFGDEINECKICLTEREIDQHAIEIMQHLLQAISAVIERQLSDHLPGGKFWEPSNSLRKVAQSCSSTNISGERKFAKMKQCQTKAPSTTMTKIESKIMFAANKVSEDMVGKTEEERKKDMLWAVKEGAKIRKTDLEKRRQYKEGIHEKLREKREQRVKKEENKREDLEDMVGRVYKYGGAWLKEEEMQNNILKLSETRKKEAIKSQITFRKQVLHCDIKKIGLSHLSSVQLQDHFKHILQTPVPQDSQTILDILQHPEKLIQRRIRQTFEDHSTGFETVYSGTIVDIIINRHAQKEFKIVYDDSPEAPCYATLRETVIDIAAGDLLI